MRWLRAFLAALSESPPDADWEEARGHALNDAVFTCDALWDWAENVEASAYAVPEEYRPGMRKAAADVLRILERKE